MNEFDEIKQKLSSKLWKTKQQGFKELQEVIESKKLPISFSLREWAKFLEDTNPLNIEQVLMACKSYMQNKEQPFELSEGMELMIKNLLSLKMKQNSNLILDCFDEIFTKYPKEFINCANKIILSKSQPLLTSLILYLTDLLNFYGPISLGFEYLVESFIVLLKESGINSNHKAKIIDFFKEVYKFVGPNDFEIYLQKIPKAYSNEFIEYKKKNLDIILKNPVKQLENVYFDSSQMKNEGLAKQKIYTCNENWVTKVLEGNLSWQIKKEMLEEFYDNIPNIPTSNYESLVSSLNVMIKRLLNDNNQNIIIIVIRIIERLFEFFPKETSSFAKALVQILLEKFKDKKAIIIEETHKALESLKKVLTLEEVSLQTYFSEVMENKSPGFRLNTLIFVNKLVNESNLNALLPIFKRSLEDQIQEIRELSLAFLIEMSNKFGEQKLKSQLSDLPTVKILQIFKNPINNNINGNNNNIDNISINKNMNTEQETSNSYSNNLLTLSQLSPHNNNCHNSSQENPKNDYITKILSEKKASKTISEIFLVQELEFLRMSKKMRVFQIESKKINENELNTHFEMMKMQFTQVFTRGFRDGFFTFYEKNKDNRLFFDSLAEFHVMLSHLLEGANLEDKNIKDNLMKIESVSDLILKYLFSIFKILLENQNENQNNLNLSILIVRNIQLIIKVLSLLKQNFSEFELKFILNISLMSFLCNFHEQLEEDIFKMIENLTVFSINSSKMSDFFLEEFKKSEPKAWKFRDQIVRLFSNILIKMNNFPLNSLQDYWEIISNRKIITNYKEKHPDFNNLKCYSEEFFYYLLLSSPENKMSSSHFNIKSFVLGNISIEPEVFNSCLDIMRNSNDLSEKIDSLLLLNDMAMSEMKENNHLFYKNTDHFIITFLLTLRETLLEAQISTQFPHFFLNCLQKFLGSGLLDLKHSNIMWLAEEILFVLARNENENIQKLLNLCLIRILSFGDIQIITIGFWNLLVKYSKLPCYSLIFSLVNLSIFKIMKRIEEKEFPFNQMLIKINEFLKKTKKVSSGEDANMKIIKYLLYKMVQYRGLEIIEYCKKIPDISEILARFFNINIQ